MSTDINMSLDDIIKKNKSIKNFNPRKRQGQGQNNRPARRNNSRVSGGNAGGGNAGGGKMFGGPRFRNNSANRSRPAARFSPYKRGDINNEWSHDLYEDGYIGKRIDYDAVGTKIVISNLDYAVTDNDLEELFFEMGPLLSTEVHYDRSGRSLGKGSVIFEERADAMRAIKRYDGVPLDGRAMEIELASAAPPRMMENRRPGNFRNRNPGNGGGGGGGGGRRRFNNRNGNPGNRNRRNSANLSVEKLDAELDEIRARAS